MHGRWVRMRWMGQEGGLPPVTARWRGWPQRVLAAERGIALVTQRQLGGGALEGEKVGAGQGLGALGPSRGTDWVHTIEARHCVYVRAWGIITCNARGGRGGKGWAQGGRARATCGRCRRPRVALGTLAGAAAQRCPLHRTVYSAPGFRVRSWGCSRSSTLQAPAGQRQRGTRERRQAGGRRQRRQGHCTRLRLWRRHRTLHAPKRIAPPAGGRRRPAALSACSRRTSSGTGESRGRAAEAMVQSEWAPRNCVRASRRTVHLMLPLMYTRTAPAGVQSAQRPWGYTQQFIARELHCSCLSLCTRSPNIHQPSIEGRLWPPPRAAKRRACTAGDGAGQVGWFRFSSSACCCCVATLLDPGAHTTYFIQLPPTSLHDHRRRCHPTTNTAWLHQSAACPQPPDHSRRVCSPLCSTTTASSALSLRAASSPLTTTAGWLPEGTAWERWGMAPAWGGRRTARAGWHGLDFGGVLHEGSWIGQPRLSTCLPCMAHPTHPTDPASPTHHAACATSRGGWRRPSAAPRRPPLPLQRSAAGGAASQALPAQAASLLLQHRRPRRLRFEACSGEFNIVYI